MLKKILLTLCLSFFINFSIEAGAQAETRVKLETSMGDIVIELNEKEAPITSKNFIKYVKEGFYDGLIFHRVINNFMIQAGGFTPDMKEKQADDPIKNEANNGLPNSKYTIAMARTSEPHSASAQFFINTKDNAFLNYTSPTKNGWGYAVFGKVVEGQNIVDAIEKVKTANNSGHGDVPIKAVTINKAVIVK